MSEVKKYGVNELRSMFLKFFESKGHLVMKSFSLVPHNDNSLLIINSGMAPLKPYFTGQEIPPRHRVTTCQKCIRTGDLENVGKTARHGTFFEMLGNFSFGDYFKREAIHWSWEFLTEVVGLDPNRLYPSVYTEDEEAFAIWRDEIGIAPERIYKFGKADNFWEHGSGPCGPCSEIYYDRGEKFGNGPEDVMGGEGDRFMEVWNNVFSQFNNDGHGHYTELVQKNIDTGMGLERLAVVVQDVGSIFDVDTIKMLRDHVCKLAGGISYEAENTKESDISVRIVVDHIRSTTFMISDGIMPSNEGRGYVLRRLIRRAVRHGRKLNIKGSFLPELASTVIEESKDGYPELIEKRDFILNVIQQEEEKFDKTYEQGLEILASMEKELEASGGKMLSGENAFRLYDTYGFPVDSTKEILEERGYSIDEDGFEAAMKKQRETARNSRKTTNYMGADATIYEEIDPKLQSVFVGYDTFQAKSRSIALVHLVSEGEDGENALVDALTDGMTGAIITEETPFYATMGGQIGDKGTIESKNGSFEVRDTLHVAGNKIAHIGQVTRGMFTLGEQVELVVDEKNRKDICRNHSATHLLQKALREVLGTHVEQAGSYQDAYRTRFDFSHFQAMTPQELKEVEDLVNEKIQEELPVGTKIMSLEDARKSGAMALFGEKYGDEVRVVTMGDFSTELCGGTHVKNTVEICSFKIVSESGIAAGVRRIEALTGRNVRSYFTKIEQEMQKAAEKLKASPAELTDKITHLQEQLKKLQSENESLKRKEAQKSLGDLSETAKDVNGTKLIAASLKGVDMNGLRDLCDTMKQKEKNAVIVLVSDNGDKAQLVVMADAEAVKKGAHAGNLIKQIAPKIGGGGGGRPDMAQAGGKNPSGIADALKEAEAALSAQLIHE